MVRLWLTNIDDNSVRCLYLFEAKPFKLSLIKSYDSSNEWKFRNDMLSLYKLILSLLWKGGKRFATTNADTWLTAMGLEPTTT